MNVAYIGSTETGHSTYPPRITASGSGNVLVNGRGIHRKGDGWGSHTNTVLPYDTHSGATTSGSSSVYANGLPVARVGDGISCGGAIASGSSNVFVGG